ncbi:glutathione transferase GstA [Myxococcus llanfairpwllgwyngyllgogerychwyrndrobwllllantysiliogogogochensis]|uniref:Glutathione transferase GstA n=1 Tax=Myxococcus llanfairpwllgwyngyllgogerychwyrndrobwllllantysiliogogogochensis TaxID=2590453 RepID=A0A540WST7_9BACT|nr:glutathione transferase GstA [Myxococcus llanfairpwllgwyngyllgogerychwyrndrobwllllantysiliogogogochensis]TQF12095.1 glutathione transferase GstA [Myxococcus llanfairpwllgwyngyllgogerychwyrndrobwllllantysiliogogogochensis]
MKLYFAPGACSLSPHIVAHEAGLELQLEKVDTQTKVLQSGGDFWKINPKGYVPALELEPGEVLTEGPALVLYLADLRPEAGLVPAEGSRERYRVQEMLGYINSELHKTYAPLFQPTTPDVTREERTVYLFKRYKLIEERLATRAYLFGDTFNIADAYLYTVTRWAKYVKVDLSGFPNLMAFMERVSARPAVRKALAAEGLPV